MLQIYISFRELKYLSTLPTDMRIDIFYIPDKYLSCRNIKASLSKRLKCERLNSTEFPASVIGTLFYQRYALIDARDYASHALFMSVRLTCVAP